MRQCFLFALLIGGDDEFSPVIGKLDGAAFAHIEVFRGNLLAIDQSNREPVGQPRAKFLHQIERQRGPVWAFRMQETDERIQADAGERGKTIMSHESIQIREKTVYPVAWRASASLREGEFVLLLFQGMREGAKIIFRSNALKSTYGIDRCGSVRALQGLEMPRKGVGGV